MRVVVAILKDGRETTYQPRNALIETLDPERIFLIHKSFLQSQR